MKYVASLLLSLFFLSACGKDDAGATKDASTQAGIDSMKANMQAVYEIMGSGNLDELDKYIAADFVEHQLAPGYPEGLEGMKKFMTDLRVAYPDMKMTVEDIVAEGDQMAIRFRMTGTNTGDFMGMKATGKSVNVEGVDWIRVKDGKGVEHWGYMEEMKMMTQLGMMPGGEGMGEAPAEGAAPAEGEKKDSGTGA